MTTTAPPSGGTAPPPSVAMVSLTIDGIEVSVPKGTLVIRAAEEARDLDPALLRPPAPRARRRLPPVPRRGVHAGSGRAAAPDAQATGVVHRGGVGGHGCQDPAHLAGGRQGAARRHGAAPDQPPARLPGLRQGRRVPAAEPGDEQRPRGVPLRGQQADLPQADQHLQPGAARPRALRPVRPVHAVLRPDRRRPVHRPRRARGAAAGRHLRGAAVRVLLLGQHGPDLSGGSAHRRGIPLPVPSVRPRLHPDDLRALRERLRPAHRPPARDPAAPDGRQRPGRQRGVELRQGAMGLHLRHHR